MTATIYTDGSCSSTQGGWGVIIYYGDKKNAFCGYTRDTTNQRMEMISCIYALQFMDILYPTVTDIVIHSDSAYVVNCFLEEWFLKWQANGWKTANKKSDVKNRDLWERLIKLVDKKNVRFVKVKGHSNNRFNNLVDELANFGRLL